MKKYPKIPTRLDKEPSLGYVTKFWVFDKLDGSNIRVEWSAKRGFYKYGTRKRLVGCDDPIFGKVLDIAKNNEKQFAEKFKEMRVQRAVCFFEFWGERSFAGTHNQNDEHTLSLIDISVEGHGILEPDIFCNFLEDTDIRHAKLLHLGRFTEEIKEKIKKGILPGMTFEGVVAKARRPHKWNKPIMVKVKNKAWVEKVKANYDKTKWEEML
jgi:hypothetical protein